MVGGGLKIPEKTDSKLSVYDNISRDSNKSLVFQSHLFDGCMLDQYNASNVFTHAENSNLKRHNDIDHHSGPGFEYDPQTRLGKFNGNLESSSKTDHHTDPGFEYDPQARIGNLNNNPETYII